MSNSKNLPYYFNPKSQESRWEPPEGANIDKLKVYMAKNYTSSGLNPKANGNGAGGDKIRCAHLLVKHRDSRRPTSWRESKITRTKEEAREILQGYEARIKKGEAQLMDLAVSESDCGSARKRGDL
jgi:peptidyl-prolyl cis-trans isomerase NIMA-interacting 1